MTISKWNLDPAHTDVDFSIRHMMISQIKGAFTSFSAELEADPTDLTTASIAFTVDLNSIDTRIADRDAHLRSADFFNVEEYPTLTFAATKVVKTGENEYELTGDVTLHGVTRSETLNVEVGGTGKDPWGNERVGFTVTGKLKRSEYNLTYNAALETGGVLIGDDVKISVGLEFLKQA